MNTQNKELITRFKLPSYIMGKSFADASRAISSKFEGRNDMVSNNTKNELLKRLADAQEFLKSQEQSQEVPQEQMAYGGFDKSIIGQAFGEDATGEQQTNAIGAGLNTLVSGVDLAKSAFGTSSQDTSGLVPSETVNTGSMIASNALKGATAGASVAGVPGALIMGAIGAGAGLLGAGKAKKAAAENTTKYATNINKQFSDQYANGGILEDPILPMRPAEREQSMERYKLLRASAIRGSGVKSNYKPNLLSPEETRAAYDDLRASIKPGYKVDTGYRPDLKNPEESMVNYLKVRNNSITEYKKGGKIDPTPIVKPLDNLLKPVGNTSISTAPNITNTSVTLPNNINQQVYEPSTYEKIRMGLEDTGKFLDKVDDKVSDNTDLLRYAPAVMNAVQLAKLKKPSGVQLARLDNRYRPEYVDLAQQQNIANQELTNVNSAIQQSGTSQGASRAALLGAQLNKTKALSNAYANAQAQNAQQNAMAQQFNLGVDQTNLQQSNLQQEINDRNIGNYDTQKSQLLAQLGTDIGNIGKEELYKQYPERMGLTFDSRGRAVNGSYKNTKGEIFDKSGKMIYDANGNEVKQFNKGGFLNQDLLSHINNMYIKRNKK